MSRADWVWMPHAGHLCVGHMCRFHLNTKVGRYIVSTVGEYQPSSEVRELLAESRGIKLSGRGDEREASWLDQNGFEDIGYDRKYETMVFHAEPHSGSCCPWRQAGGEELDMQGYNEPEAAYQGHLAMCEKWEAKSAEIGAD